MEWNCCWSMNTVTPFLIECIGDSEDVNSDVHHVLEEDESVVMDGSEGMSFRFDDVDGDVHYDDDDAQSCSYDHSSYINSTCRYGDHTQHDQSQRLIFDDHEDGSIDDGDIDVINGDRKNNWGENKLMLDSSKPQNRSHKICADSSNQREIDRKFWEACFAT
ncbi:hypothetical protein E3N88_33733 [Mikania micrantha]|uniref:Uncharacterized protein n=1 Tax=Mikania micrantha TaxID=192012 RepID=A0A5N6MCN7_9ASTR|nr:hypothetical protein E3N88_33733 [Mikania micrantha]